ncbi:MAG: FMN-binding negative transcriptional regulator [Fuerstiella sp.]|nr:FMN-binding negative transcriptional regulator [Fuerstiella sp.]MCP4859244.1 FMN-binding negative transcriptional regulator [Fuerstiella sp.]
MYTPPSFAVDDLTALHNFIEAHSFGMLTSVIDGTPVASHLPLLLERETSQKGTLACMNATGPETWKSQASCSANWTRCRNSHHKAAASSRIPHRLASTLMSHSGRHRSPPQIRQTLSTDGQNTFEVGRLHEFGAS